MNLEQTAAPGSVNINSPDNFWSFMSHIFEVSSSQPVPGWAFVVLCLVILAGVLFPLYFRFRFRGAKAKKE